MRHSSTRGIQVRCENRRVVIIVAEDMIDESCCALTCSSTNMTLYRHPTHTPTGPRSAIHVMTKRRATDNRQLVASSQLSNAGRQAGPGALRLRSAWSLFLFGQSSFAPVPLPSIGRWPKVLIHFPQPARLLVTLGLGACLLRPRRKTHTRRHLRSRPAMWIIHFAQQQPLVHGTPAGQDPSPPT
jgi:hypothetical protein